MTPTSKALATLDRIQRAATLTLQADSRHLKGCWIDAGVTFRWEIDPSRQDGGIYGGVYRVWRDDDGSEWTRRVGKFGLDKDGSVAYGPTWMLKAASGG